MRLLLLPVQRGPWQSMVHGPALMARHGKRLQSLSPMLLKRLHKPEGMDPAAQHRKVALVRQVAVDQQALVQHVES